MASLNRGFSLTWLGHGSFKLATRGARTVLLDPWVEGNPACPKEHKTFEKIDVMTISHGHGDHMGDAVTLGKKFKPVVVCNYEIHVFLQKKGVTTTSPMNKGGTQEVHGIGFTMVHALHSSGIEDGGAMVSPTEAAVAARLLQPRLIVPIHHGTFPALTGTPDALREALKKQGVAAEVVALRPGEALS